VRQTVIQLVHGYPAREPVSARPAAQELGLIPAVRARLEEVDRRLAVIEQRVGTGPDTDEVERLRALLRQHGIDPQDKPA
jgi:hypothetical protein